MTSSTNHSMPTMTPSSSGTIVPSSLERSNTNHTSTTANSVIYTNQMSNSANNGGNGIRVKSESGSDLQRHLSSPTLYPCSVLSTLPGALQFTNQPSISLNVAPNQANQLNSSAQVMALAAAVAAANPANQQNLLIPTGGLKTIPTSVNTSNGGKCSSMSTSTTVSFSSSSSFSSLSASSSLSSTASSSMTTVSPTTPTGLARKNSLLLFTNKDLSPIVPNSATAITVEHTNQPMDTSNGPFVLTGLHHNSIGTVTSNPIVPTSTIVGTIRTPPHHVKTGPTSVTNVVKSMANKVLEYDEIREVIKSVVQDAMVEYEDEEMAFCRSLASSLRSLDRSMKEIIKLELQQVIVRHTNPNYCGIGNGNIHQQAGNNNNSNYHYVASSIVNTVPNMINNSVNNNNNNNSSSNNNSTATNTNSCNSNTNNDITNDDDSMPIRQLSVSSSNVSNAVSTIMTGNGCDLRKGQNGNTEKNILDNHGDNGSSNGQQSRPKSRDKS